MTLYNKLNNLIGWVVFIIATGVYVITSEPTGSFWDCGEFISCAWKMQVAHSPGAPLFLILGRIFTLFAGEDGSKAAIMVNFMSNVMGGLTSLFIFWTITALGIKIIGKKASELSASEIIIIMGAGLVGAFASTFSDSTWFSTVEGEVYSSSAAFTAFVVWAILKWDAAADTKYADKWLLMVAYAMGLSIGVHLLNLLCIPAMVFVFYFKKYPYSRWGLIKTFFVSCIILGAVQFGVIQSLPYLAASTDILFVNTFHLPFNSGSLFVLFTLVTTLAAGIYFSQTGSSTAYFAFVIALILTFLSHNPLWAAIFIIIFVISFAVTRNYFLSFLTTFTFVIPGYLYWFLTNKDKDEDPWKGRTSEALNKIMLAVVFIIIGYSSYTMVLIRASANPAINMSYPKDLINLLSYLDREQYGDRPLLYGQTYAARVKDVDWNNGDMKYWKGPAKYEELGHKPIVIYDDADKMLFPRVFDDDPSHVRFYKSWLKLGEDDKPTFADNIRFFASYQVIYMYWRYFLWNFAGRQNDVQGTTNNVQDGNWISGITFIDNMRLGPQDNLPPSMADNKAKNKYYFLPLILGLIGMLYHFKKVKHDAFVVLLLFFFTGIAIVLYLNQTPLQPRERDYAYQGSVYAYCIWIGIGVLAIWNWLKNNLSATGAAVLATGIGMIVPAIMGAQGWDDHDRSNRYTCRDFGRNYLESCAKNAIVFTQGDNDTYPLWYAQEVENIRPDVRIVNLSLLGVDWYIENLRRKINDSDPVALSIPSAAVRGSKHDVVRYFKNPNLSQMEYYNLTEVVDFMTSDDPNKKIAIGESPDNYLPVSKLYIPVDKKVILENNVVQPEDTGRIVPRVEWTLNRTTILKPSLMVMDIIQQNNWKRPIYFAISVNSTEYLGLNNYLQQEGLTYRLVPVKQTDNDGLPGGVQPKIMYENVMNKFAWGGVDKHNVYLDENILRMVTNLRSNFARLSNAFIKRGDSATAIQLLDKCQQVLPEKNVPYSLLMLPIAQAYYKAGAPDKGKVICKKLLEMYNANMVYFTSLDENLRSYYTSEMNEAVYALSEILQVAESSKQEDLLKEVEPIFTKYRKYYTDPKSQQSDDDQ